MARMKKKRIKKKGFLTTRKVKGKISKRPRAKSFKKKKRQKGFFRGLKRKTTVIDLFT